MKRIYSGILAAAVAGLCQATPSQQQQADPTMDELLDKSIQNQDDMLELASQIDAERASLKQQILDLMANNAPLLAKATALYDKSEAAENKLRAGIAGLPPVGGTPLLNNYPGPNGGADFDAAAAAYTGPEAVKKDGIEVKQFTGTGDVVTLEYYSHSADGSVNTTGPSD